MSRVFAEGTSVSVEKSKAEIEKIVTRYGASAFQSGWREAEAAVSFEMKGRAVRFILPLPSRNDPRFKRSPGGRKGLNPNQQLQAWEQSCREKWRALLLSIKGKLEAVQSGITIFDDEFLAQIVDPGTGQTVGELMRSRMARLTESKGKSPLNLDEGPLRLPAPSADGE